MVKTLQTYILEGDSSEVKNRLRNQRFIDTGGVITQFINGRTIRTSSPHIGENYTIVDLQNKTPWSNQHRATIVIVYEPKPGTKEEQEYTYLDERFGDHLIE